MWSKFDALGGLSSMEEGNDHCLVKFTNQVNITVTQRDTCADVSNDRMYFKTKTSETVFTPSTIR